MTKVEVLKECKELLKTAGLTQVRAAAKIGICAPYLNQILLGNQKPSDEVFYKILELNKLLKRSGLLEAV